MNENIKKLKEQFNEVDPQPLLCTHCNLEHNAWRSRFIKYLQENDVIYESPKEAN